MKTKKLSTLALVGISSAFLVSGCCSSTNSSCDDNPNSTMCDKNNSKDMKGSKGMSGSKGQVGYDSSDTSSCKAKNNCKGSKPGSKGKVSYDSTENASCKGMTGTNGMADTDSK